jgi:hypothetical protein
MDKEEIKMSKKLRATMTWSFEPKPEWYEPDTTLEEMAKIESAAALEDALMVGAQADDFKFIVKVEE